MSVRRETRYAEITDMGRSLPLQLFFSTAAEMEHHLCVRCH